MEISKNKILTVSYSFLFVYIYINNDITRWLNVKICRRFRREYYIITLPILRISLYSDVDVFIRSIKTTVNNRVRINQLKEKIINLNYFFISKVIMLCTNSKFFNSKMYLETDEVNIYIIKIMPQLGAFESVGVLLYSAG